MFSGRSSDEKTKQKQGTPWLEKIINIFSDMLGLYNGDFNPMVDRIRKKIIPKNHQKPTNPSHGHRKPFFRPQSFLPLAARFWSQFKTSQVPRFVGFMGMLVGVGDLDEVFHRKAGLDLSSARLCFAHWCWSMSILVLQPFLALHSRTHWTEWRFGHEAHRVKSAKAKLKECKFLAWCFDHCSSENIMANQPNKALLIRPY